MFKMRQKLIVTIFLAIESVQEDFTVPQVDKRRAEGGGKGAVPRRNSPFIYD